ncbi:aminoglycoside phosphotransferase family protein [Jiangella mangrovi]|uniref:Aminoglycoside phosphotransferase (APT) family kinase protein n=1 Tax=Jiangella mangrovi TaxID=1524084 RepID=A0A7W9GU28_9ACTN|nr:aminoglycoside phosphotransferase family protein [Jiangella mangrovi]MBB5790024.1 aminoglycoside phosphotransferase (APT) family kinase protein [Jiangella mangrovi]
MTTPRMHADQLEIDAALVRRLLAAQFPQWAGLALRRVRSAGTVNAVYRLGDELSVRLPLVPEWAGDLESELEWLPRLADGGGLPLEIPEPVAAGEPGEGYPARWAVYRWLDGVTPEWRGLDDPRTAGRLAEFVRALRDLDPGGAPEGKGQRLLAADDDAVREAIASLAGTVDTAAATAVWTDALAAEVWDGERVWVHGDLLHLNLLTRGGELSAVLDFGSAGAGDGAYDLLPAWTLFTGAAREAFRAELAPDDAAWARGRGYALAKGLIALPYYRETNPVFAAFAREVIDASLA